MFFEDTFEAFLLEIIVNHEPETSSVFSFTLKYSEFGELKHMLLHLKSFWELLKVYDV